MKLISDNERRRKSDLQKEAIKEVMREWLDEQYAKFGKWSLRTLIAIVFLFIVKSMFQIHALDFRALFDATGIFLETAK